MSLCGSTVFSRCLTSVQWRVCFPSSFHINWTHTSGDSGQRFCALQGVCLCAVMKDGMARGSFSIHHQGPQVDWHCFTPSLSSCLCLSLSLLSPPFFVCVASHFSHIFSLFSYNLLSFQYLILLLVLTRTPLSDTLSYFCFSFSDSNNLASLPLASILSTGIQAQVAVCPAYN